MSSLTLLMLPLLQAYSENSIEEMREQKEKGGMDNLEMFGILFCPQSRDILGYPGTGNIFWCINKVVVHYLIC